MPILLNATVTTAVTAATTTPVACRDGLPRSVLVQGKFTYGSGGTTADAWVQTSIDNGVTWIDACNMQFTTSSARKGYNLSALTAVTTVYPMTDGTLAANTAKDGMVGPLWRVKYTTVGTYAGSTTLRVDVSFNGSLA